MFMNAGVGMASLRGVQSLCYSSTPFGGCLVSFSELFGLRFRFVSASVLSSLEYLGMNWTNSLLSTGGRKSADLVCGGLTSWVPL